MILLASKGFLLSGTLIMAIGAQNAFVIRQGIMKHHLFLTASLCSLIDAILIGIGVFGFGKILSANPSFIVSAKVLAIIFLLVYGAQSLFAAFKNKSVQDFSERSPKSVAKTVAIILAFSLLNPHAYLDTVVLMGSFASSYVFNEQIYFAFGAVMASFVWFFSLTYGSKLLAPIFSSPKAISAMDFVIAIIMWVLAITLLVSL